MSQHYSDPTRENDKWALPDVEVFQLTAEEVAERDEDMVWEYMKRPEFKLAGINSRTRAAMIDAMVDENNISGGWFYWYCFPGCMPESEAFGPYETREQAVLAAQNDGD